MIKRIVVRRTDDSSLDACRFLMDHDVKNWEEFREFNEKFPDASDAVVWSIIMRLMKKGGVSVFGF